MPLALTPPNGICASSCTVGPLTWQMPDSMRRATFHRAPDVAPEHRRRQAVLVVVGAGDRGLDAVHAHDALHRAERSPRGRCASQASRGRARSPASACCRPCRRTGASRPSPSASSISALQCSTVLMSITEPSTTGSPCAGRRRGRPFAFAASGDEVVGDLAVDDDALGGHADLPRVGESAERGGVHRGVEIGVVEHDQRRLAAELEHDRLQVLRAGQRDQPADARRAGEVDAPHRRVRDHRLDDRARVGRRVA